jgi:hypothetical protein
VDREEPLGEPREGHPVEVEDAVPLRGHPGVDRGPDHRRVRVVDRRQGTGGAVAHHAGKGRELTPVHHRPDHPPVRAVEAHEDHLEAGLLDGDRRRVLPQGDRLLSRWVERRRGVDPEADRQQDEDGPFPASRAQRQKEPPEQPGAERRAEGDRDRQEQDHPRHAPLRGGVQGSLVVSKPIEEEELPEDQVEEEQPKQEPTPLGTREGEGRQGREPEEDRGPEAVDQAEAREGDQRLAHRADVIMEDVDEREDRAVEQRAVEETAQAGVSQSSQSHVGVLYGSGTERVQARGASGSARR